MQDGITETNHGIIDYLVVVSTEWWNGLDEDVRTQLATILKEVSDERNADSAQVNQEARQAILDAGATIRELDEAQRQAWVAAMKPVWAQFEADVGADNIAAAQEANAIN